jgi:isoamylase
VDDFGVEYMPPSSGALGATQGSHAVAFRLEDDAVGERDDHGRRVSDDNLLILMNAHSEPVTFRLPAEVPEGRGEVLVDTAERALAGGEREREKGGESEVRDRGMVVMPEAL